MTPEVRRGTAAASLAAAVTLLAALVAPACKSSRKHVLVAVHEIPPAASALEAEFLLDGVPAVAPERLAPPAGGFPPSATFVTLLPDDAAGTLAITVEALDGAGCAIAAGSGPSPATWARSRRVAPQARVRLRVAHGLLDVVQLLVRCERQRGPRVARVERLGEVRRPCMLQPHSIRSSRWKLSSKRPDASATV